jgi:hypothetical protein
MKIVQSCWNCNRPNLLEYNAGWYAPEYHLMSWALSCLQLTKFHDNLALYADSVSARTLIDELKLPYSAVHCELDELNKFDPGLWALPKIYTYSRQEEAFLHIDADVFIWKPFDKGLLSGDLIAQNIEIATDYYENIMQSLEGNLKFFPKEIVEDRKNNDKIYAYNAGIMGGSDIPLFKEYTSKAFDFINRNAKYLHLINVSDFNIFYEQYLFYCIVKKQNKEVSLLINEPKAGNEYYDFADFEEVPHKKQFLHLLGLFKDNKFICDLLANRLRLDYPEYYYRIIALFKNKRLPLRKDYYSLFDGPSEKELITRYSLLRANFISNKISIINENDAVRAVEPNFSMVGLVKGVVERLIAGEVNVNADYEDQLCDIETFENNLNGVLKYKFAKYSNEYLYARNITCTGYFQTIFQDRASGYNVNIITDSIYDIIESRYDWSRTDSGYFGQMAIIEQLNSPASEIYVAIVPECDLVGYSLFNIDELDLNLLEICKEPCPIVIILAKIALYFDQADLEESRNEFEELITERIKVALRRKLIKVAQIDR